MRLWSAEPPLRAPLVSGRWQALVARVFLWVGVIALGASLASPQGVLGSARAATVTVGLPARGLSRPSPPRALWTSMGGLGGADRVSCERASRHPILVIVKGPWGVRRRDCAALHIQHSLGRARGSATVLGLRGGAFWAQPVGTSRGTEAEAWVAASGSPAAFTRVVLTEIHGSLRVLAHLAGALGEGRYRFVIRGVRTVRMAVTARLWGRGPTPHGETPALVSLYDYGVGGPMPVSAVHLARHAADGVWVRTAKAAYWEPLRDPRRPWSGAVGSGPVRAFGLLQRDRKARYYGRGPTGGPNAPDVRVYLKTQLRGRVRVSERPAWSTRAQNILAAFVPRARPEGRAGWPLRFVLVWSKTPALRPRWARVVDTLVGGNAKTGARKYVIDYAGGVLGPQDPRTALVGHVHVRPDTFVTQDTVGFNPYTGGWRQVIQVLPVADHTVHIEAWLTLWGRAVSEVWSESLLATRISR